MPDVELLSPGAEERMSAFPLSRRPSPTKVNSKDDGRNPLQFTHFKWGTSQIASPGPQSCTLPGPTSVCNSAQA